MRKNVMVAISETETRSRFYVVIDSDIATGKCLAYNPETGTKVIVPHRDRDTIATTYINKHPFEWMVTFNPETVEIPENWMK